MLTFLYILSIIGSVVFTCFLPQLWWDISWSDIFTIISGNDEDVNFLTKFTKIMQSLGITENNLKSWATERLLICLAIFLGLIIVFTILYKLLKYKSNTNITIKTSNEPTSNKGIENTQMSIEKKRKIELIIFSVIASLIAITILVFIIISVI